MLLAMMFVLILAGAASAQTGRYGFGGGGWNRDSNPGRYLGQYSANKFDSDSTSNPFGAGSQYKTDGVNNPYSRYGSKYSSDSATNPYTTNAPKLYDSQGNYRGKMSANQYDSDSISNPYGRYGSRYSADSINNPYGAGSRYNTDSPSNPYGSGLSIIGQE
jgi:hypothetical protein